MEKVVTDKTAVEPLLPRMRTLASETARSLSRMGLLSTTSLVRHLLSTMGAIALTNGPYNDLADTTISHLQRLGHRSRARGSGRVAYQRHLQATLLLILLLPVLLLQ